MPIWSANLRNFETPETTTMRRPTRSCTCRESRWRRCQRRISAGIMPIASIDSALRTEPSAVSVIAMARSVARSSGRRLASSAHSIRTRSKTAPPAAASPSSGCSR